MNTFKFSNNCFTPTLNKMGYMSLSLDKYNQSFVEYCIERKKGLYLDLGCAFGIATLPVVKAGCQIIACDLDRRHLEILKTYVPSNFLSNLKLVEGCLPHSLKFEFSSFDAINLSMVLHFLTGEEIIQSLNLMFQWLKSGGQLYVTTSSPYQGTLKKFMSVYEKNLTEKKAWPGLIPDVHLYIPERSQDLPKFNNVFTPDVLKEVLESCGFKTQKYGYFSRKDIPLDIAYDGREYTGLICQKP